MPFLLSSHCHNKNFFLLLDCVERGEKYLTSKSNDWVELEYIFTFSNITFVFSNVNIKFVITVFFNFLWLFFLFTLLLQLIEK